MKDETTCVICGGEVEPWPVGPQGGEPGGYGHNPEPVKDINEGRACDWCNAHVIIPVRLRRSAVVGEYK